MTRAPAFGRRNTPSSRLWSAAVPLATLLALVSATACDRQSAGGAAPGAGGRLAVRTAERVEARVVGADTLSDSARVLRIYPEADGDAVVFTFADPRRRVSSGLAITQRRTPTPALLWPDSVTAVWWSGAHAIAFTTATGSGVRAVVDIHAERATVSEAPAGRERRAAANEPRADSAVMRRAREYVDSLRVQPGGRPERSALVYRVRAVRMAPGGELAAFYVTGADSGRRQAAGAATGQGEVNPGWYALDVRSGAVAPVDEVTGPTEEMAESAAGWTADGSFVYAKRLAIWEAQVRREGSAGGDSATTGGTAADSLTTDSAAPR